MLFQKGDPNIKDLVDALSGGKFFAKVPEYDKGVRVDNGNLVIDEGRKIVGQTFSFVNTRVDEEGTIWLGNSDAVLPDCGGIYLCNIYQFVKYIFGDDDDITYSYTLGTAIRMIQEMELHADEQTIKQTIASGYLKGLERGGFGERSALKGIISGKLAKKPKKPTLTYVKKHLLIDRVKDFFCFVYFIIAELHAMDLALQDKCLENKDVIPKSTLEWLQSRELANFRMMCARNCFNNYSIETKKDEPIIVAFGNDEDESIKNNYTFEIDSASRSFNFENDEQEALNMLNILSDIDLSVRNLKSLEAMRQINALGRIRQANMIMSLENGTTIYGDKAIDDDFQLPQSVIVNALTDCLLRPYSNSYALHSKNGKTGYIVNRMASGKATEKEIVMNNMELHISLKTLISLGSFGRKIANIL